MHSKVETFFYQMLMLMPITMTWISLLQFTTWHICTFFRTLSLLKMFVLQIWLSASCSIYFHWIISYTCRSIYFCNNFSTLSLAQRILRKCLMNIYVRGEPIKLITFVRKCWGLEWLFNASVTLGASYFVYVKDRYS